MHRHAPRARLNGNCIFLAINDDRAEPLLRHLEKSDHCLRQLKVAVSPAFCAFDFPCVDERTERLFECEVILVCFQAQAPLKLFRFEELIRIPCEKSDDVCFQSFYGCPFGLHELDEWKSVFLLIPLPTVCIVAIKLDRTLSACARK